MLAPGTQQALAALAAAGHLTADDAEYFCRELSLSRGGSSRACGSSTLRPATICPRIRWSSTSSPCCSGNPTAPRFATERSSCWPRTGGASNGKWDALAGPRVAAVQLVADFGGQLVLLVGDGVGQLLLQRAADAKMLPQRFAQLDQPLDQLVLVEFLLGFVLGEDLPSSGRGPG